MTNWYRKGDVTKFAKELIKQGANVEKYLGGWLITGKNGFFETVIKQVHCKIGDVSYPARILPQETASGYSRWDIFYEEDEWEDYKDLIVEKCFVKDLY